MLTCAYAHSPELVITKAVVVMYMIAVLVLEVHLPSVGISSKN
jgi:hypothetical protein